MDEQFNFVVGGLEMKLHPAQNQSSSPLTVVMVLTDPYSRISSEYLAGSRRVLLSLSHCRSLGHFIGHLLCKQVAEDKKILSCLFLRVINGLVESGQPWHLEICIRIISACFTHHKCGNVERRSKVEDRVMEAGEGDKALQPYGGERPQPPDFVESILEPLNFIPDLFAPGAVSISKMHVGDVRARILSRRGRGMTRDRLVGREGLVRQVMLGNRKAQGRLALRSKVVLIDWRREAGGKSVRARSVDKAVRLSECETSDTSTGVIHIPGSLIYKGVAKVAKVTFVGPIMTTVSVNPKPELSAPTTSSWKASTPARERSNSPLTSLSGSDSEEDDGTPKIACPTSVTRKMISNHTAWEGNRETTENVTAHVHKLATALLNTSEALTFQDKKQMNKKFPYLKRYAKNWPTMCILQAHLKVTSTAAKNALLLNFTT
ncbi:hypothetical protein B0H17DRAFT_1127585 [Mycena rosella]|uniref:Uncharacterized protein n=1 Tax=Mycena rosella TaxID=1033263 RepID=A0AAD7DZ20_MYCRO|nr:hypothetical protein B0H17DRAFT_1127585 [Mycena rosella]